MCRKYVKDKQNLEFGNCYSSPSMESETFKEHPNPHEKEA